MYLRGRPPWDTGVTPPEVRALVEGQDPVARGRALDIGCGTGLNSVYLARHGWQVTGVDFAYPAVRQARRRASEAGLSAPGRTQFFAGDATRLRAVGARGPYTLLLDMGCLHGIPVEGRAAYAREVAAVAAPGALYLLYAFGRGPDGSHPMGLSDADIAQLFGADFTVERVERGSDRDSRPSAWRWLRRKPYGVVASA